MTPYPHPPDRKSPDVYTIPLFQFFSLRHDSDSNGKRILIWKLWGGNDVRKQVIPNHSTPIALGVTCDVFTFLSLLCAQRPCHLRVFQNQARAIKSRLSTKT